MDNNNEEISGKVGIVTYHRSINYGAILQTYALQRKVEEFGKDCHIIDYQNELMKKNNRLRSIKEVKGIKELGKYLLIYRNSNSRFYKFQEFMNEYIKLSIECQDIEDIREIEHQYDKFITGSDQVWNTKINGSDMAYLLEFTNQNSKKNSYAASFGVSEISEHSKKIFSNSFSTFNNILVREQQAVKIISEISDKSVQVVLDPTLLLSIDEWDKIVPLSKKNKKYIFVYAFSGSKTIKTMALNLSESKGYEIIWLTYGYEFSTKIKYVKNIGPLEFLNLIKNAEFIITNSFHGTAFSINFNKQFYLEYLPMGYEVNSRLENIVKMFKLEKNILNEKTLTSNLNIIDYDEVNKKLCKERDISLNLLNELLSEGSQY